ncbi:G-protein coupled receptor 143-like [Trichogramma pretiosum]|uniref:G-protein coupled receptor 143-like n=1 Tax=Trichogramma pretiosum TaxID=7493 RepID=UPI0006C9CCA7|nr:G-protein coupled receptor 143-like [Trichogramma pretiosum]
MADPTIQTFCCHHNNRSDLALVIMDEFNTDAYNTVCMVSSSIGIFGAIYQVLPRQELNLSHRWQGLSAARGREIIVWLAVADLLASSGVFIRSALWMNFKSIMPMEDDTSSVVFCAISSAWTQYFYMATWIWTLCYAIDMKLLLGEKLGRPFWYHIFAWLMPAILTTLGLTILYVPNANCYDITSLSSTILRILPNYLATYGLLAVVMVANPLLYLSTTKDLKNVVTRTMAQMTGRERKLVQTIKLKFAMTNVVYYVCWIPNLLNGILLWTLWFQLPVKVIISLWYVMAVMNPLQAFFNALVYKRWGRRERFKLEWCYKLRKLGPGYYGASGSSDATTDPSESSPLIDAAQYKLTPRGSVNNTYSGTSPTS